jgi:hypothetical protein
MADKPYLTTCEERGIVCNSCQENVNVHGCEKCRGSFQDRDAIYCKDSSREGARQWHKRCV